MAYKDKEGEVYPLLTTDWLGCPTYRQKPVAKKIRGEDDIEPVIEDDDEVFDIIDQKKKRNVNLVWIDVALMALDYLQILALIQSMSLRWTWPEDWLRSMYWLFGFNADVWEIKKIVTDNVYRDVQDRFVPSADVGISFGTITLAWYITAAALMVIYVLVYTFIRLGYYPYPWARQTTSWIQFGYMIIIHAVTLPIGTVVFRLFHCESVWNTMDTMNENKCWSSTHLEILAPAIVTIVIFFVIYPAYLIWKIKQECLTGSSDGYLSFILLKETEYKIHLNHAWLYDSCFLFSSFKFRGIYYRPMIQFLKLGLLIICTGLFGNIKLQSMIIAIFLLLAVIVFIVVRPFRLTSCNVFLIFGLLCLSGNGFIGSLRATYNAVTIPSSWLLPQYIIWFIAAVQIAWVCTFTVLLVYLISRTLCHSTKSCYKRPVWPNISTSGSGQLTWETRKFMVAVIRAKIVQEKIIRMPAMFATVHDIARHIQIINAYSREAEYLGDAMHMILWQTLDGLVEVHAEISPRSLFADSVKKSVRKTAAEFMSLVPMFSRRLAQRDYDFILVNPVKKRLLLKMYIMGLFLNGRSEKVAKKKMFDPAVGKVWPPLPQDKEFEEEDGYYEDLYPNPIGHFTDELLNVVVDNASDEETSEEEDNLQNMIRNFPEVGVIDLESPVPDEVAPPPAPSPHPLPGTLVSTHTGIKKHGVLFGPMHETKPPRSMSAASKSSKGSSLNSSAISVRSPQTPGSLYSSVASLRQEQSSAVSLREPSPQRSGSPIAAGSTHSLRSPSPGAPRPSPASKLGRPISASSSHSETGRSRSPGQRPPSAGSVISSQSSRPLSPGSELSDHELALINPGYIPEDDSAENETGQVEKREVSKPPKPKSTARNSPQKVKWKKKKKNVK